MLGEGSYAMGDLWDGGGTGDPFPSMARGREKVKRNPEEGLGLAGTGELLEVGRGEAVWFGVG